MLLDLLLHVLAQVDQLLLDVGHPVDMVEAVFRVTIALLCDIVLTLLRAFLSHRRIRRGKLFFFTLCRFFLRFRLIEG